MKMKSYKIKKSINLMLMLQIGIVLVFHLFTKRGLALDGSHNLIRMIAEKSFYFLEIPRQTTYFFQQLPAYLTIQYTNISSLDFLIFIFSFGLIWIFILSLLGCFLILPYEKKQFLFFPLFFFIIGPLTALGVSISASLSVSSYLWFSAFVIYYSDLSKKSHQLCFLIAPLPLFLSHEMMSYMAPVLILLCILKLNFNFKKSLNTLKHNSVKIDTKNPITTEISNQKLYNKLLIYFIISYLILSCLVSWFFLFFPVESELKNRSEFFQTLLQLNFLLKWDKDIIIYPTTVTASLILAFPFFLYLKFKKRQNKKIFYHLFFTLLFLFGLICLLTPFNTFFPFFKLTGEEDLRVWVTCIALPLSLLIWFLYENQLIKIDKNFIKAFLFISMVLSLWRIGSDYQFYKFQKQIEKQLKNCQGIVSYDNKIEQKLLSLSGSIFHISSYSLLFQNQIQSLFSHQPKMKLKISRLSFNKEHLPDDLLKNQRVCYINKERSYSMCQFFNLEKLNQSRFFKLSPLIQDIQYKKSSCKKMNSK